VKKKVIKEKPKPHTRENNKAFVLPGKKVCCGEGRDAFCNREIPGRNDTSLERGTPVRPKERRNLVKKSYKRR